MISSPVDAADSTTLLRLSPAVSPEKMLANMRSSIARGLPQVTPCKPHGLVMSVAGGGPSLADTYRDLDGYICAVNGSLKFLLDREIKEGASYACGIMDAGDHMADMIVANPKVRYYVASICDPTVFEKLKDCDVRLWHVTPDSTEDPEGVKAALDDSYPGRWCTVGGGTTMGLRWVNLGYFLGFRKFKLHGLDSSFRGGASHAYPDRADQKDWIEIGGRWTRLNFLSQVESLFATIDVFANDPNLDDIGIEVFGDGLLQDEWTRWNSERDTRTAAATTTASSSSSGPRVSKPTADGTTSLHNTDLPLICCVKVGTKYGSEYVLRLRDAVARHLPVPHRFVCFTDDPVDGVECFSPPADLPGWWSKIGLFKLKLPLIYFDLDVVITGDLSPLLDWQGFSAIKDWWQPGINSSVMKLSGKETHVWENFDPKLMRKYRGGDQEYIGQQFPPNLKTFPPNYFPSYKANKCQDGPPSDALAVIFHGFPKPSQCSAPWVHQAWTGQSIPPT